MHETKSWNEKQEKHRKTTVGYNLMGKLRPAGQMRPA